VPLKIYDTIPELLHDIGIQIPLKNEAFFICRLEDYFGDSEFAFGPYKHHFFEITFGKGHDVDCKIGPSSFKTLQNCLSFATPYQISSWKVNSFQEDSLGYMIYFHPSFLHQTYSRLDLYKKFPFFNINAAPMLELSEAQMAVVIELMSKLHEELNASFRKGQEQILRAYLTIFLEKMNRFFESSTSAHIFSNRAEEITFQFESILKEKVHYKLRLSEIATDLNMTTNYLSEAVKKSTGKSAKSILQESLILNAKGLLSQSNETIANIAYQLGFEEVTNFTKYFKLHVGLTPSHYRKKP